MCGGLEGDRSVTDLYVCGRWRQTWNWHLTGTCVRVLIDSVRPGTGQAWDRRVCVCAYIVSPLWLTCVARWCQTWYWSVCGTRWRQTLDWGSFPSGPNKMQGCREIAGDNCHQWPLQTAHCGGAQWEWVPAEINLTRVISLLRALQLRNEYSAL